MIPRVGSRAQRSVPNPPQVESKIVERSRCVRAQLRLGGVESTRSQKAIAQDLRMLFKGGAAAVGGLSRFLFLFGSQHPQFALEQFPGAHQIFGATFALLARQHDISAKTGHE